MYRIVANGRTWNVATVIKAGQRRVVVIEARTRRRLSPDSELYSEILDRFAVQEEAAS